MKILIWAKGQARPSDVGVNLLDAAIIFITHGKGSHAAFLRADNATVHEAFWPRVRDRAFTDEDAALAEVYELEGLTPEQHATFEHLFDSNLKLDIKYSIVDLFRFLLGVPSRDETHTFCSRYVMHCLQALLPGELLPLVRLPDGDWASPRDVRISPRLTESKV